MGLWVLVEEWVVRVSAVVQVSVVPVSGWVVEAAQQQNQNMT
jgi:hypothetical protein